MRVGAAEGAVGMGTRVAGRCSRRCRAWSLALVLEREETAGVVNWRDGYHKRTLSLAGLGRLEFLIPRDRLLISAASWCRFASGAARSWKKTGRLDVPGRTFHP